MVENYTNEHGDLVFVDYATNVCDATVWLGNDSMVVDFKYEANGATRYSFLTVTFTMFDSFTDTYLTCDATVNFGYSHEDLYWFVGMFAESLANGDDLDYLVSDICYRVDPFTHWTLADKIEGILEHGSLLVTMHSHEVVHA